jgi:hypothetical protein
MGMMKLKALALLPLLFVATAQATWVHFTSTKAGFSVDLPIKPEEESSPTMIEGHSFATYIYTAADSASSAIGIVTAIQVPGLTKAEKKNVMDGYFKSFIKSAKATQVSRKSLSLHGYSGEEVVFTTGAGKGAVWTFIFQGKMYGIVALGIQASAYDATRSHIFNSFRVAGRSIAG